MADELTLDLTLTQGDFTLRAHWGIAQGARVALLGGSGEGKSTLLLALAGFLPVQGRLLWQGREISALPPAERPVAIQRTWSWAPPGPADT